MGPPNSEIKTVFGQCKCCLKETYLKNMWEPLETKGNIEMYGQMLVDCFGMNWSMQNMGDDNMCQVCIAKLRVAVEFKKQILDSRATYAPQEGHEEQNAITVSEETIIGSIEEPYYENTLVTPLATNDSTMVTVDEQDSINSTINLLSNNPIEKEAETESVQKRHSIQSIKVEEDNLAQTALKEENELKLMYVEKDNDYDGSIIIKVDGSPKKNEHSNFNNDETNEGSYDEDYFEEEFLEDDEDLESDEESKPPKKLPQYRNQKQYTDIDLERALSAITSKRLTIDEAFEKYNVPVRTLKKKLRNKLEFEELKSQWPKKLPIRLRNQRYRQYTEEDLKKAVAAVRTGEMVAEDAAEKYHVPVRTIRIKSRQKLDHTGKRPDKFNMKEFFRVIRCLIHHTNVTLFKTKGMKGFSCFFCPQNDVIYKDAEDLRNHTHSTHQYKEQFRRIELVMRPHYEYQLVRIDIHNLVCDCKEDITWSTLPEHLKVKHDLTNVKDSWKKIIPYDLKSGRMSCVFPSCRFVGYFCKLDGHMNIHYPNFVCSHCAKPLITEARLKMHEKFHEETRVICKECKNVFPSRVAKAKHVNLVHKKRWLYNCTICEQRFPNDTLKLIHLKSEHSDLLETHGVTCVECNITFWPSDYYKHVQKKHKKYSCDVCSRRFTKELQLTKHVCKSDVKHNCKSCNESFHTHQALRHHRLECSFNVNKATILVMALD